LKDASRKKFENVKNRVKKLLQSNTANSYKYILKWLMDQKTVFIHLLIEDHLDNPDIPFDWKTVDEKDYNSLRYFLCQ